MEREGIALAPLAALQTIFSPHPSETPLFQNLTLNRKKEILVKYVFSNSSLTYTRVTSDKPGI